MVQREREAHRAVTAPKWICTEFRLRIGQYKVTVAEGDYDWRWTLTDKQHEVYLRGGAARNADAAKKAALKATHQLEQEKTR